MGNKLPRPGPHQADSYHQSEIIFLQQNGYPDVHVYAGVARFSFANGTHLFRVSKSRQYDEVKHPSQKFCTCREITHFEVFKRKSIPFEPMDVLVLVTEHRFKNWSADANRR